MRTVNLEGIVLSTKSYSESDKLITVFTKEQGKVHGIAKGIKKLTSRKRASLEVFTHIRFQITKSNLGIITEAQPLHYFENIRSDLKSVAVAYFLCESINKSIADDASHSEIFGLLLESLLKIESGGNRQTIRESFTRELLVDLGYVPEGVVIGNPLKELENVIERKLGSVRIGKMLQ